MSEAGTKRPHDGSGHAHGGHVPKQARQEALDMRRVNEHPKVAAEGIDRMEVDLTDEQEAAVRMVVKERKSVFLTGPPGTGKSVVVRAMISRLPKGTTQVCGSTGIAAINVATPNCPACTIHRFLGLGRGKNKTENIVSKIRRNEAQFAAIASCTTLIIDEVSMLDAGITEQADDVMRHIKQVDKPFGGVVVVLVGDMYQLPPVGGDKRKGEPPVRMMFESLRWDAWVPHAVMLKAIHRQSDKTFIDMLGQVRDARVSPEVEAYLKTLARPFVLEKGEHCTNLFATNNEAAVCNTEHLALLPGQKRTYAARDWINPKGSVDENKASYDSFKGSSLSGDFLSGVGAACMAIVNLPLINVWNGMTGMVIGYTRGQENGVIVKFDLLEKPVTLYEHRWSECEPGDPNSLLWTRDGIPLCISYGITVHKSQGLTIKNLKVHMHRIFAHGQAYVALSRAKSPHTLQVLGLDVQRITANEKVARFYADMERRALEDYKRRAELEIAQLKAREAAAGGGGGAVAETPVPSQLPPAPPAFELVRLGDPKTQTPEDKAAKARKLFEAFQAANALRAKLFALPAACKTHSGEDDL